MSGHTRNRRKAVAFLFENSIFLIGGALAALIWANIDAESYNHFVEFDLSNLFHHAEDVDGEIPGDAADAAEAPSSETGDTVEALEGEDTKDADPAEDSHGHGGFTIHFLVNDILMALFFAIAASEVWEALLPGGALSNPKKAATPLLATVGGIAGPAGVYLLGVAILDRPDLTDGWAIPCATDIAFSYLIARFIFGTGHPAIAFLLLLAIADDAAGLIILAVAYPSGDVNLWWLLLSGAAMALGFGFRKINLHSFWWYLLIPGTLSWISFYKAGIHPALGLVPVIITKPHAHTDLGIFAREELDQDDTLNQFVKAMADPVEIILGLFGLVNAGVAMSSVGSATWLVLAGLLIGKPFGIVLFTWFSERVLKLEMPKGMDYKDVFVVGTIAAIGFTVALFVSTAAFKPTDLNLPAAKMGALASFVAAILAILLARFLKVKPYDPEAIDSETGNNE
jgi:Na+:H+ antiporter, NhaA family